MKNLDKLNIRDKKYIIFDLDGTLIDSIGVWNLVDQRVIQEYGGVLVNLDSIQIERDAFLHSHQDSDIYLEYCRYLIQKYHLNVIDPSELLKIRWDLSGRILENEVDFKPDVVELIFKLKKLKFVLILATMTTQVQIDIYAKKNRKMFSQMNILEVFDFVIRKEDVKSKKPNPEIYTKIVEYYHAKKEEYLVFEDSYTGVLASKNAGLSCINIYDKYADIDRDKINNIVDYSILNYREFIDLVDKVYRK